MFFALVLIRKQGRITALPSSSCQRFRYRNIRKIVLSEPNFDLGQPKEPFW